MTQKAKQRALRHTIQVLLHSVANARHELLNLARENRALAERLDQERREYAKKTLRMDYPVRWSDGPINRAKFHQLIGRLRQWAGYHHVDDHENAMRHDKHRLMEHIRHELCSDLANALFKDLDMVPMKTERINYGTRVSVGLFIGTFDVEGEPAHEPAHEPYDASGFDGSEVRRMED